MKTRFHIHLANLLAIASLTGVMPLAKAQTTYLWNVATPGSNNWNVAANWVQGTGYPGSGAPGETADTAVFGNTGFATSETVNNAIVVNTTISALSYTNTTSGDWFVTDIPAGVTLIVTNLTVGGESFSGASTTLFTDVGMTDAGTLVVNGSMLVGDNYTASGTGSGGTLDLSGLSNFVYNAASGTINLSSGNRSVGNLKLAAVSNTITAGTFNDNTASSSSGGTGNLTLGAGTNIFNVNTFNVAAERETSTVAFPAGSVGSGLRIRGAGGANTNLCNLTLGNHNSSGTSSDSVGTLSVDGYPVDIMLGTLALGESSAAPTAVLYGEGEISFDTGTIFASNIVMGIVSVAVADAEARGIINVGSANSTNATLIIGTGGMSLVNQVAGAGPATGTLNVTGGTVICSNSIIKTTVAGTATITYNAGTLDMVAGTIGALTNTIDSLTFDSAVLNLNVNGIAGTDNIYGNSVSASGSTINISSVTNVIVPTTIHLISYNTSNGDPFGGFTLGSVPAGYVAMLVDNSANSSVDLSISPNETIVSLLWAGAVGSTLNSNWDFTTTDWLNTNGSAATYTNPDLLAFDDTASNAIVTLKANFTPGALVFSNSGAGNGGLDYTFNGSGSIGGAVGLVKSVNQNTEAGGALTLTETGGDNFSGGIIVNAGTVILDDANSAISGGAVIGSGATLQIGNNDANGNLPSSGTLSVDGTLVLDQSSSSTVITGISGTGALVQGGGGRVTLSAANGLSGPITVTNGTLALSGTGTISNSASVTVTSATLDVSGVIGTTFNSLTIANAILNVSITNNLLPVNVVNGLTMNGTTNTINVAGLPGTAGYPTTITLIQAAGGLSGFNAGLGTLPSGYTGYLTNNINGANNAVQVTLTSGPIGTRPNVTWNGADAGNNNLNWSDGQNWQLPGAPISTDNVIFNQTAAQSVSALSTPGGGAAGLNFANVSNIVNTSFTVTSLTYTNIGTSGSPSYQNTFITNGAILTITNSLAIGSSSLDFGDTAMAGVTVSGTNGTLTVNNTNSPLVVNLESAAGAGSQAVLDMSALGTFNADVNSFQVGAIATASVDVSGVVYLAQTNTITAVGGADSESGQDETLSLMIGESGKGGSTEAYLYLGQQNIINAYTIGIGIAKQSAEMEFNPIEVNPTVTIHGGDGVSPVTVWSIADGLAQTGASTSPTGTADFTGGTVNALVTAMYLGFTPNASGAHAATGTLTFGAGTISVGTLFDGRQIYNTSDNGAGTVNVNGTGILQVSTLNLGFTVGTAESSPTTGTLNITNGTVEAGTIAADTNNTGQSTINLSSGVLIVTNTVGTPADPLTALNLNGGTLQLNVNGDSNVTNIVAAAISTNGITVVNIGSVANVTASATNSLISYAGNDPYASLSLGTVPSGYTGSLVDNSAAGIISLTLTSVVPPVSHLAISRFSLSGANVMINGTNEGAGACYVLTSTNLLVPLSQWTPVTTNVLSGGGSFTLTATNAVFAHVPQQFYILSTTNK